ncbi:hypothetical protein BZA77DRAFT_318662 [Pyronema omphalodes]|nr:hypothetical protein BZA77DRAFT_318662 [Pyronema omphalodes]
MLPTRTETYPQLTEPKPSGYSITPTRQSHDGCLQPQKLNHDNLVDAENRLDYGVSQRSDVVAATDDNLEALEHRHTELMGSQNSAVEKSREEQPGVTEQSHEDISESVPQSHGDPSDYPEEYNHISQDSQAYTCNTDTNTSPSLAATPKQSNILDVIKDDRKSLIKSQPSPQELSIIRYGEMYDLSQLDDRGVVRSFEKLGSEIHRFSLPFYTSDRYNHQKLVQGLENLELYKKLVRPWGPKYYPALKKCLKHKSARRSFIDGLLWVALTTWVFDSYPEEVAKIEGRISALWNVLEDMPQKPLPPAMVDNEHSSTMMVLSPNTHNHQSIIGKSTESHLHRIFEASEAWAKIISQQKDKFVVWSDISNEKPQRHPSKLRFLMIPGLYKQIGYDDTEVVNTECVLKMQQWKKRRTIRKALRPVAMKLKGERKTARHSGNPVRINLEHLMLFTTKGRGTFTTKLREFKNSPIHSREEDPRDPFRLVPDNLFSQPEEPLDRSKGTPEGHENRSSAQNQTNPDVHTKRHSSIYSSSAPWLEIVKKTAALKSTQQRIFGKGQVTLSQPEGTKGGEHQMTTAREENPKERE